MKGSKAERHLFKAMFVTSLLLIARGQSPPPPGYSQRREAPLAGLCCYLAEALIDDREERVALTSMTD
jgi:hypothetical protein